MLSELLCGVISLEAISVKNHARLGNRTTDIFLDKRWSQTYKARIIVLPLPILSEFILAPSPYNTAS